MRRTRMTTPVPARNGVEGTKLGIRPCSFIAGYLDGGDNEIGAGYSYDLDRTSGRDLRICGGGQVVGGAGEADQHGTESARTDSERNATRGSDAPAGGAMGG